nr:hypothetical protein HK105_005753 [Polyrhizophydium stewartii]
MLPFDATKYMPRSERPASAPSSSHASSHRRSGSSHHSRQTQWPPEFVVRHVDQDDLYRAELAVPHPPGALPRCHTPASSQGIGISSGAVEYVSDSESPRSARDSVFERISRPVSKCAMRHPDHGVAEQNDIAEKIHQRRLQSKLSNIKRLILHVKMQQTPLELKPVLYRPIQIECAIIVTDPRGKASMEVLFLELENEAADGA